MTHVITHTVRTICQATIEETWTVALPADVILTPELLCEDGPSDRLRRRHVEDTSLDETDREWQYPYDATDRPQWSLAQASLAHQMVLAIVSAGVTPWPWESDSSDEPDERNGLTGDGNRELTGFSAAAVAGVLNMAAPHAALPELDGNLGRLLDVYRRALHSEPDTDWSDEAYAFLDSLGVTFGE